MRLINKSVSRVIFESFKEDKPVKKRKLLNLREGSFGDEVGFVDEASIDYMEDTFTSKLYSFFGMEPSDSSFNKFELHSGTSWTDDNPWMLVELEDIGDIIEKVIQEGKDKYPISYKTMQTNDLVIYSSGLEIGRNHGNRSYFDVVCYMTLDRHYLTYQERSEDQNKAIDKQISEEETKIGDYIASVVKEHYQELLDIMLDYEYVNGYAEEEMNESKKVRKSKKLVESFDNLTLEDLEGMVKNNSDAQVALDDLEQKALSDEVVDLINSKHFNTKDEVIGFLGASDEVEKLRNENINEAAETEYYGKTVKGPELDKDSNYYCEWCGSKFKAMPKDDGTMPNCPTCYKKRYKDDPKRDEDGHANKDVHFIEEQGIMDQDEYEAVDYYLVDSKLQDSGMCVVQDPQHTDYFVDLDECTYSLKDGLKIILDSMFPDYFIRYPEEIQDGLIKVMKHYLGVDISDWKNGSGGMNESKKVRKSKKLKEATDEDMEKLKKELRSRVKDLYDDGEIPKLDRRDVNALADKVKKSGFFISNNIFTDDSDEYEWEQINMFLDNEIRKYVKDCGLENEPKKKLKERYFPGAEERYFCRKCGLAFNEDELTSEDDNGNDLCPACGSKDIVDTGGIEVDTNAEQVGLWVNGKVYWEGNKSDVDENLIMDVADQASEEDGKTYDYDEVDIKPLDESVNTEAFNRDEAKKKLGRGVVVISKKGYSPASFIVADGEVYFNSREISFGWNKHPSMKTADDLVDFMEKMSKDGCTIKYYMVEGAMATPEEVDKFKEKIKNPELESVGSIEEVEGKKYYVSDSTFNGYCFKDMDAYYNRPDDICYITEHGFEEYGTDGKILVDVINSKKEELINWGTVSTRNSIFEEIRVKLDVEDFYYEKDDKTRIEAKDFDDKLIEMFADDTINMVDWQSTNGFILEQEENWLETVEDYYNNKFGTINESWTEVDSKYVKDSDGFTTEYTMYKNEDGKYAFVFGDKDIYKPEDGDFDWEAESEKEAREWFDSYTGFNESVKPKKKKAKKEKKPKEEEKRVIMQQGNVTCFKENDNKFLVFENESDNEVEYKDQDSAMKDFMARVGVDPNGELTEGLKRRKNRLKETSYGDINPEEIAPDAYLNIEDNGYGGMRVSTGIGDHTDLGSGNYTKIPDGEVSRLYGEVISKAKNKKVKVHDKLGEKGSKYYDEIIPRYNADIEQDLKDLEPFKGRPLKRKELDTIRSITGRRDASGSSERQIKHRMSGEYGKLGSKINTLKSRLRDLDDDGVVEIWVE